MATYYQGSSVQTDNTQTLHLLNTGGGAAYAAAGGGGAGYSEAAAAVAAGNMILLNHPTSAGNHPSQHFLGIPFATQQAAAAGVSSLANPSASQQDLNSSILAASRMGNHAYGLWRNRGSELSFMGAPGGSNQSLAAQLNESANMGDISQSQSQMGLRRAAASMQEQQTSAAMLTNGGLSLQSEHSPHTSSAVAHGQGLSLSLSSQQPLSFQNNDSDINNCPAISAATTSEDEMFRADRNAGKWNSAFRSPSSRDGVLGADFGYAASFHGAGPSKQQQLQHLESVAAGGVGGFSGNGGLLGSKYLKAAQQLLEEVVNVGRVSKSESRKQEGCKPQSWIGSSASKENSVTEGGGGDGAAPELTPAERQELQMKKGKLIAMLDEVDQRYRQYYQQMQIVVNSFETAAGFGAARTYTAVALQTISRHFRCLRDAISGQIKATSKALGEDDSAAGGKGETSRLRFVDQQLRQQRALQQLGMIQQHAWRPQRGLPERSVSVLRTWLFEHFLHPYPKDADKIMLAKKTGLSRNQVSNWFINARVRLWKPMVEEMYLEELKESEAERASNDKSGKEASDNNKKEDSASAKGATHDSTSATKSENAFNVNNSNNNSHRNQAFVMAGGTDDSQIYSEVDNDGIRNAQQQMKKPRTCNGVQDSAPLLSPNMSVDVDLKSDETNSAEFAAENNKFSEQRHHNSNSNAAEDFTLLHNGMLHANNSSENAAGFGSYPLGDLSRFGQAGGTFAPRFTPTGGVSLTLGLQHADGLSLQGNQHSFLSAQNLGLGNRRHDLAGTSTTDYCNMDSSAAHPHPHAVAASIYDNLGFQNQKRFATQLMH